MRQCVHAFIEHKLAPEEILRLPDHLLHSQNNTLAGQWQWTTGNMDTQKLSDLWAIKTDFFINKSWSDKDLAVLEKTGMRLHFFSPQLVTFDTSLSWTAYRESELLQREFNHLSKAIASLLEAVNFLLVPDLSSVAFFDENQDLTVNTLDKRQTAMKRLQLNSNKCGL